MTRLAGGPGCCRIVLAGEAAGLWGTGAGWPGFVQMAQSPGGAHFIGPTPAQIPQILAKYPLLEDMEVPAGADLGTALPQAAFSTLANTLAGSPSLALLHPVLAQRR